MANFFLIDHSLRKPGGHHFDYVRCVAQAASEMGFLTTIGANRDFRRTSAHDLGVLERLGNVRSVFRDTTYQADSYLAGLQHLTRSDSLAALNEKPSNRWKRHRQSLIQYLHRRRREKFVKRFALDCERYFRPLLQVPGDHTFLTTVSELELMGLAVYLSNHPKTIQTHWHLQFHFNLLDGRTPEYEGQEATTRAIRSCCLAALSRLSSHSVHFYTTSDTLVDQYNRLGVGKFSQLPYPISQQFAPTSEEVILKFGTNDLASVIQKSSQRVAPDSNPSRSFGADPSGRDLNSESFVPEQQIDSGNEARGCCKPLKITCPGEVRREKGHVAYLQPLVDEIWPTHLSTGDVRVVVQRPAAKWPAKRQKIALRLPSESETSFAPVEPPIEYFSHPLSDSDYVKLIKSTDCGLLFYDSRVYFSRRAGVLGELLACGKPVIVPAGSWLAEQVAEPIFQHAEDVVERSNEVRTIHSREFKWDRSNAPMAGGVLSFDHGNHPFDFSIEPETGENAMVLEFDWHWPNSPGTYCHVEVAQKDEPGNVIRTDRRVIGFRSSGSPAKSLFKIDADAQVIEFSLSNAFHDSTASIKRAKVRILEIPIDDQNDDFPIGSVGVVACDQRDLANCVDEIVKHFDHYRATATAYSKRWYAQHDPKQTVGHLVSVAESASSTVRHVA